MSDNRTIHLVEIPIGGKGGSVWNRLHGEREDTCETLARISGPDSDIYRELLHARLRKLDAALDRLMSGSYGNCPQCGLAINETRLAVDPATSLCLDCSGFSTSDTEKGSATNVVLEELKPFDTALPQKYDFGFAACCEAAAAPRRKSSSWNLGCAPRGAGCSRLLVKTGV